MIKLSMSKRKRIFLPLGVGLFGTAFLAAAYFGIVSWAESPRHAVEFFWQDRWIVILIILGFGVQAAIYAILKLRLFLPVSDIGVGGPLVGASGATSTIA